MEMKLNPQRVKTLRLSRSWSQEQLAEQAGLNPRTIQRVETEGTASLSTRLHIAKALGVEPNELDMPEVAEARSNVPSVAPATISDQPHRTTSLHLASHLPVLLLISLIYLAWTPLYFSLSRSNFQAMGPEDWSASWASVILAVWCCLALPWMGFVYFRRRTDLRLHMIYLGALVFFSVLRAVQEELARSLLSLSVYLAGLGLLYTCYRESGHRPLLRQVTFVLVATYLFVWLIQKPLSSYLVVGHFRWERGMDVPLPWVSFPRYVLRLLSQTTQLFPIALVMLFDLGKPRMNSSRPGVSRRVAADLQESVAEIPGQSAST